MADSSLEKLDYFLPIFVTAEIVGILSVLLMFYWCVGYAGGFGLSGGPLFTWHPLFMTIGLIYLMGNGILMFRVFRNSHKTTLKYVHASVNAVGLVFTLLAAVAVIVNHNQTNKPNFYSLHSWVGITAVGIYVIQAVVSIFAFLLNGISNAKKALLLPYHVFCGHVIFVLGIATAIAGLNEKAFLSINDYSSLPSQGILVNIIGVLFVTFGVLIVYITTNIYYKRYPRPEDNQLLERRS